MYGLVGNPPFVPLRHTSDRWGLRSGCALQDLDTRTMAAITD